MAATEGKLGELHDLVATLLMQRLSAEGASASDFANAIKLLKDNNITCVVEEGSKLHDLQKALDQAGKKPADAFDLATALEQVPFTGGLAN